MPRIKVLHAISSINIGGAERLVVRILDRLDDKKYEKFLIIFIRSKNEIPIKNINVNLYHINKDPLKAPFSVLLMIYKIIKTNKIHVVHSHLYLANFFVRIAAYCAGCRNIIFHEHGGYLNRSLRHRLVNFVLQIITNKYIFISQHDKQHFIHLDRIKKKKAIYVIPNPLLIEGKEINKKNKSKNFTVGMIGQLIVLKGHKYGLQAFSILQNEGYKFKYILIGDGPEKMNLIKIINENNLDVLLPGTVLNIEDYLREIDVLVHPSISEGFGLVILEAMYFGIPVIASAVGGITEIILNGINGILVCSKRPIEISNKIKELYHNGAIYDRYSNNAKSYVKNKYSIENYMQNIMRLYND